MFFRENVSFYYPDIEDRLQDPKGPALVEYDWGIRSTKGRMKVALVDDRFDLLSTLSDVLYEHNFAPRGFHINATPEKYGQMAVNAIVNRVLGSFHPKVVICDKGLGWIDGIEANRQFADIVPTIMLTGEPGTRETHRVATLYVEKPITNMTKFAKTIYELGR